MSFDFSLLKLSISITPPSGNSIGQVLTFSVKKKERKIKTSLLLKVIIYTQKLFKLLRKQRL